MAVRFAIGARVDGLYDGNADDVWYPGVVHAAHDDATFDVLYDDGEAEFHVVPQFLRPHQRGTICVGTRVFGRYASGDEWYPGKIQEVLEDGTFTVEYDDGEVESGLAIDRIRESMAEEEDVEATPQEEEEVQAEEMTDQEPEIVVQENEQAQEASGEPVGHEESAAVVEETVEKEEEAVVAPPSHSVAAEEAGPEPVAPHEGVIDPEPTVVQEKLQELLPREAPARRKSKSKSQSPPAESAEEPANVMLDTAQSVDEYANILSTMEQLESSFADALTTKTLLSTLVKQMRAFPQATADLVHTRCGEALLIDILKRHHTHAVIQCYGFVLLRRLCFLCGKSTHYFLRNGIIELVTIAMRKFAEDAILQASACGALAVFTRVHAGLTALLENRVSHLVLATIIFHKRYSVHTRQVHYYACEVLLELCELGDKTTIEALCGDSMSGPGLSDLSPVSLLLFLLRQALSFDDKKACCAVGTLLMCLASCHRHAAQMVLDLNGLSELSTVMAKYPMEPGIQKYAASASKEIALCSMEQPSPTQRRVQNAARDLLGESSSMEDLQQQRLQQHRQGAKVKAKGKSSTGSSKRKAPQGVSNLNGFPTPGHQQHLGAVAANGRDGLSFSKYTSPIGKAPHLPPNIRSFNGAAPSPSSLQYQQMQLQQQQQQCRPRNQVGSPLVILDGLGHGGSEKKKVIKEERHNLLFETYGVDAKTALHQPQAGEHNVRTQGIKRRQLKTHIVAATGGDGGAISWASPVKAVVLKEDKPLTGRSDKQATKTLVVSDTRKTRSSGGHASHNDADSEELSPATLRRQQLQAREAKKRETETDEKTPRSTTFRLKLDGSNASASGGGATGMVSPIAMTPRGGNGGAGSTKPTTKPKKTARQGVPVSSRLSGGEKTGSNESLNSYAAQLFKEEMQAPAASPSANAAAIKAAQERERLSFAEKLHKMIDKAKSSLAHGSTVSLVVDSPVKAAAKRPNNGNAASVNKKKAPTSSVVTSRVVPASTKPVASTATPNNDNVTQKRPVAASVKPAPPKKTVVVASTPVAKPATPASKPMTPVPLKASKAEGLVVSRPSPATTKSGSASVRPKPTSAAAKAPASTTKSTAEKKADKKASDASTAAALAGAAVVAAASAAAVVLVADEKDSEPATALAEAQIDENLEPNHANEEAIPLPEPAELPEGSRAATVATTEDEVQPHQSEEHSVSADSDSSATEESSTPSLEAVCSSTISESDPPTEAATATVEAVRDPAETFPEEKTAEEAVAEAAAVAAAASATDDLYADEYNDFDDLDGGDNAPPTVDDDAIETVAMMGRGTSFEALMNLTAQVTTRHEDDSGILQFSVAAPAPAAAPVDESVAEANAADATEANLAEEGDTAGSQDDGNEEHPVATEDTNPAQEGSSIEAENGVETVPVEVAESESATSGKYDHAEEAGGIEEDQLNQPEDSIAAVTESSESEPKVCVDVETSSSSDEQQPTSDQDSPAAASDDSSLHTNDDDVTETAEPPEPDQEVRDEAFEQVQPDSSPDIESQEDVDMPTPSKEERPESRQTDMPYGDEDFEDTPEDTGDETTPEAAEEESPSQFEAAEAATFEFPTEIASKEEEVAAEPARSEGSELATEVQIDGASGDTGEAESAEVVQETGEGPPSSGEIGATAGGAEVVEGDAANPVASEEVEVDSNHVDSSLGSEEACLAPEAALELPANGAAMDTSGLATESEEASTETQEDIAVTAQMAEPEAIATGEAEIDAPMAASEAATDTTKMSAADATVSTESSEIFAAEPSSDETSGSDSLPLADDEAESTPPDAEAQPSEEEPRAATPDAYGDSDFGNEDVDDPANDESAPPDRDSEPVAVTEALPEQPPSGIQTVEAPPEEDRSVTPDGYSDAEFGGDEAEPSNNENAAGAPDLAESPASDSVDVLASPEVEFDVTGNATASHDSQEETATEKSAERVATPDVYAQEDEFEEEPQVDEATNPTEQQQEPAQREDVTDEPAADLPQSEQATEPETSPAEEGEQVAATTTEPLQDNGGAQVPSQSPDEGDADADVVPVGDESASETASPSEDSSPLLSEDASLQVESTPEQPSSEDAEPQAPQPLETEVVEYRPTTPDEYGDADFAEEASFAEPMTTSDGNAAQDPAEQPHEDAIIISDVCQAQPTEMEVKSDQTDHPTERASTPEAYADDGDFEEHTARPEDEAEEEANATKEQAIASNHQAESDVADERSEVGQVETDNGPMEPPGPDVESDSAIESSNGEVASDTVEAEASTAAQDEDTTSSGDDPSPAPPPTAPEESEGSSELSTAEPEPSVSEREDETFVATVEVRPATPEQENVCEDATAFGDDGGDNSEPVQDTADTPQEAENAVTVEDTAPEALASPAEEAKESSTPLVGEPSVDDQVMATGELSIEEAADEPAVASAEEVRVEAMELSADEPPAEASEPSNPDKEAGSVANVLPEASGESMQEEEPASGGATMSEVPSDPTPERVVEAASDGGEDPQGEAYADEYAFDEEVAVEAPAPAGAESPASPPALEVVEPTEETVEHAAEERIAPASETDSTRVEAAVPDKDQAEEPGHTEEPTHTLNEEPTVEAVQLEEPADDKIEPGVVETRESDGVPHPAEAINETEAADDSTPAVDQPEDASQDDGAVVEPQSVANPDSEPPTPDQGVKIDAEEAETTPEVPQSEEVLVDAVPTDSEDATRAASEEEHASASEIDRMNDEATKIEPSNDDAKLEEAVVAPSETTEPPLLVSDSSEPLALPEMPVEPHVEESKEPTKTDDSDDYAFDGDSPADEATPPDQPEEARRPGGDSPADVEEPQIDEAVHPAAVVADAADEVAYNDEDNDFDEPTPELVTPVDPSPISSSAPSPPASDEVDYEDFEPDEPAATQPEPALPVEEKPKASEATEATEELYADEPEEYNDFEEDASPAETSTAIAPVAPVAATIEEKKTSMEAGVDDAYEAEEGFEDDDNDAKTTTPPRIEPPAINTAVVKPAAGLQASSPSTPTAEEDADNDYEAEYDEFED